MSVADEVYIRLIELKQHDSMLPGVVGVMCGSLQSVLGCQSLSPYLSKLLIGANDWPSEVTTHVL